MLLSSLYHIQLMSIGAKLYPPCVTRMNTCMNILLGHTNSVDCVHACSPISWSYSILGDIGERDNALLCISNQTSCYQNCKVNWFFPNGTRVPHSVAKWDIYTELELRCWYVWTVEEMEWWGSITVRYMIQWMLPIPYTLVCTTQTLVLVSYSVCKSC